MISATPEKRVSRTRCSLIDMASENKTRHNERCGTKQKTRTVSIFLPPIELVVDRQRHAFLEPAFRVRRPTSDRSSSATKENPTSDEEDGPDDEPAHLQAQRHVEVLRHVLLAPYLLLPVGRVDERGVLDRLPSQESAKPAGKASARAVKARRRRTRCVRRTARLRRWRTLNADVNMDVRHEVDRGTHS